MRRIVTWTLSLTVTGVAVTIISAILLTNRAVAAAQGGPTVLCIDQREANQLAAESLPMSTRDRIVASSANFALGARMGLWWHVREATIAVTYETFWSEKTRSAIFDRIAAKIRQCPAKRR